jgi:hypothetical protein
MTDLSRNVVPPPESGRAAPAVPPAFDDEEPWPVDSRAPDAGGMVRFAALILALTGAWGLVTGLVALTEPSYFRTATARLPVHLDYTTWGWVHIVIGALALVAGFGVLAGNRLASVVGVVLAVVSAVVNLAFITASPGAAILAIGLDLIVIWGITTQVPQRHSP